MPGNMALTRRGPNAEWTGVEQQAALEIGHDLGRAMLNAGPLSANTSFSKRCAFCSRKYSN